MRFLTIASYVYLLQLKAYVAWTPSTIISATLDQILESLLQNFIGGDLSQTLQRILEASILHKRRHLWEGRVAGHAAHATDGDLPRASIATIALLWFIVDTTIGIVILEA